MVIKNTKIETKPSSWRKKDYNRWTDFIELICIKNDIVTVDEIVAMWSGADFSNESMRGESDHSKEYDKLYLEVQDYFKILKSREKFVAEFYPFFVTDDGYIQIKSNLNEKNKQYLYLLLSSSIALMDDVTAKKFTTSFEIFSRIVMKQMFPVDANVELFGTSRGTGVFEGTLRSRIEKLAECLGVLTTKRFDNNPDFDGIHGGDGGLDIVAFQEIDNAGPVPFAFAQCTCSYDKWGEKQLSVGEMRWKAYLDFSVNYQQYMFIPFSCHDPLDKFYNETGIYTIVIDRIRLLRLIQKYSDEGFQEEINNITAGYDFQNVFI